MFAPNVPESIRDAVKKVWRLPFDYYRRHCSFDIFDEYEPNAGGHGVYYQRGPIGIKVVRKVDHRYTDNYPSTGHRSKQAAKRSLAWKLAKKEFGVLVKLANSGHTPKPYALRPVKIGSGYLPAIFMEHIEGEVSPEHLKDTVEVEAVKRKVGDILQVCLTDHYGNFVQRPDGTIILIDMDPQYFIGWHEVCYG